MGAVTAREFFGGATNIIISSAQPISTQINTTYRFWRVSNTGSTSNEVTLPPAATLGLLIGGPIFVLANIGPNAFLYRDYDDVVAAGLSLPANKAIIISMFMIECMPHWAVHATPFAFAYSSY